MVSAFMWSDLFLCPADMWTASFTGYWLPFDEHGRRRRLRTCSVVAGNRFGLTPMEKAYFSSRESSVKELEMLLRSKQYSAAKRIYDRMMEDKLFDTVGTFNRVLDVYGTYASPKMAQKVMNDLIGCFDPNTISFNTLMKSYAKKRDVSMVERIMLKEMTTAGVSPSVYSYAILLGVYAKVGKVEKMKETIRVMQSQGLQPNVVIMTDVVRAFAVKGDLNEVTSIFAEMKKVGVTPDRIAYSVLIDAYSKAGEVALAEDTLREMIDERIKPDVVVIATMMKCYARKNDIEKVEHYFNQLEKYELPVNEVVYSILMDAIGSTGDVITTERIFAETQKLLIYPTNGLFRSLMMAYMYAKDLGGVKHCFYRMKQYELTAEARDFSVLFNACAYVGDSLSTAEAAWRQMISLQIKPPTATFNAMIQCCVKSREMERAHSYFDELIEAKKRPNVVTFGSMIAGYANEGDSDRTETLYHEMQTYGLVPDMVIINTLLKMYTTAEDEVGVTRCLKRMETYGWKMTMHTRSILIEYHASRGEMDKVEEVFAAERYEVAITSAVYVSLMRAYVQCGEVEKGSQLFDRMHATRKQTHRKMMAMLIAVCGKGRDPAALKRVQRRALSEEHLVQDLYIFNALFVAWVRCGAGEEVENVLTIAKREGLLLNEVSYTTLVMGMRKLGRFDRANELRKEAAECGIELEVPDQKINTGR